MEIHTLDLLFLDTPGLIAAYLVKAGGSYALIETGPGSTLPALLQALSRHGVQAGDIRHVFVTHVHLDHAGAAGWWAQQGAQVYCHPLAARHLLNPARLMESARTVYGDRLDSLWGEMLPAPADRVTVLNDGDSVDIGGGTQVVALDTPGHARHHHAYAIGKTCFTGDVAGMRLTGSAYLSVTAAPPQFEPPAYVRSVDRLLQAGFETLYLTHFGEVTDARAHLLHYRERIEDVHQAVRGWINEGCSAEEVEKRFYEKEHTLALQTGQSEALWMLDEMTNSTRMCAEGIRLFVEKHP